MSLGLQDLKILNLVLEKKNRVSSIALPVVKCSSSMTAIKMYEQGFE